jgi:hypothetical protein
MSLLVLRKDPTHGSKVHRLFSSNDSQLSIFGVHNLLNIGCIAQVSLVSNDKSSACVRLAHFLQT